MSRFDPRRRPEATLAVALAKRRLTQMLSLRIIIGLLDRNAVMHLDKKANPVSGQ